MLHDNDVIIINVAEIKINEISLMSIFFLYYYSASRI